MTFPPEISFGLSQALDTARCSIDESETILTTFSIDGYSRMDEPLCFDSKRLSLLAYKGAIERVKHRFWTTTFLSSGFWSQDDSEILFENLQLLKKGRDKGQDVRRLFLLTVPIGEQIQRIQDERILLLKCRDHEALKRFDKSLANLTKNVESLVTAGCEVRLVHEDRAASSLLPSNLPVDLLDTEIAIYDDWRFDLFQGGFSGVIDSVRAYTPVICCFESYRDAMIAFFQKLWDESSPILTFLDRLRNTIDYSSTRIDYDVSWLARYDLALTPEDESLKSDEMSGVRVELVRSQRWGHVQRFLDVGTCTGRYPIALKDAVRPDGLIMGVDNDTDCVRYTQAKIARNSSSDERFRIARHDFCSPEMLEVVDFDLITCMMGTICHFQRNNDVTATSLPCDPFQVALEKFFNLLRPGGIFFFSIWTEDACREQRLLGIYGEQEMERLAGKAFMPREEITQRLNHAKLCLASSIPIQGRLDLYCCIRP